MKKTIQAAGETIADQNAKISQLNNQLNSAQKGIVNQSARIHQLKDLCDEKDRIHLNRISDGVRHGISVCAQDPVDWREYMKHSAAAC